MFHTALVCFVVLIPCFARAADHPPGKVQTLNWLRELEPLPKIHYSWPIPYNSIHDEILNEYVRLTHAASVSGEWHNRDEVDRAVRACGLANEANPDIPASIGVNYSVWHRRFDKDLPPTDTGPTHEAELDYLRTRLETIRDEVSAANERHDSDVEVSAILFDSEHFHASADDAAWNQALTAKYDAAWDIARRVFPDVRIEWYGRGAVQPSASSTGWTTSNYFALDEQGESFGCSLYRVPELGHTRETFRRTAQLAEEHGCDQVTPWIALASGYRRQVDSFHEWSIDWNYDLIYSWQLGAEINHPWFSAPERHARFAPWNKAEIAIFYPEPFGRSPYWGAHFVAYVRGAHLIRSLPEWASEIEAGEGEDASSREQE